MYKVDKLSPNKSSLASYKKYCYAVFEELRESLKIRRKVRLISIPIPFSSFNGFAISAGKQNKSFDVVFVNLWPYLRSRKGSQTMPLFYLYSVVAHELKHIKILQDWYDGINCEFDVLFSQWTLNHFLSGFFVERMARNYLLFRGASELKKRRYDVSPIELLCYQFGFQEAFIHFSDLFDSHELELAQTIIDSINFIVQHFEIDYFSGRQAYNRFTHTFYYLARFVQRHPKHIERCPQLSFIFNAEGLIKSPELIFAERTDENARLIDRILIRMFITTSLDWGAMFKSNPDLHHHINALSNTYCAEAVDYLKNTKLGEVFLHQSVLQDNAAMLIKNVHTLNQLMDTHCMNRTSGSLIPMYYSDDFTQRPNPNF